MNDEENVKGPEGSSDAGAEVKVQHITLSIKEQEGEAMHFKVRVLDKFDWRHCYLFLHKRVPLHEVDSVQIAIS